MTHGELNLLRRPPHRDELTLRRDRGRGCFWQADDGLVVRVAAPELSIAPDAEELRMHRELLAIACRDAAGK